MISRQKIIQFNESYPKKYIHLYGSGAGLCAELVGILKGVIRSWQSGYCFSIGVSGNALGTNTPNGWNDLFYSIFPEKSNFLYYYLNRYQLPYSRRLPFINSLASMILRKYSDGDIFMLNQSKLSSLPGRIVFPDLDVDAPYWKGMSSVANTIFEPIDEIMGLVEGARNELELPERYLAVHLRRGDKVTEIPYTETKSYVQLIETNFLDYKDVFVASDDYAAVEVFHKAMPHMNIITMSQESDSGYDQAVFNMLSSERRLKELKRFLVELRLMQDSHTFIGSSTSNIYYFLQYMRGNQNIFDAHESVKGV